MMTLKPIVIVSALVVTGCASIQVTAPAQNDAPMATIADAARGHIALKAKLRDPDSAKFSLDLFKPGAVCGLVNAKNGFGGYTGPEAWLYLIQSRKALLLTDGDTQSEKEEVGRVFEKHCGAASVS